MTKIWFIKREGEILLSGNQKQATFAAQLRNSAILPRTSRLNGFLSITKKVESLCTINSWHHSLMQVQFIQKRLLHNSGCKLWQQVIPAFTERSDFWFAGEKDRHCLLKRGTCHWSFLINGADYTRDDYV